MPIDFPGNPSIGQQYTYAGKTCLWRGYKMEGIQINNNLYFKRHSKKIRINTTAKNRLKNEYFKDRKKFLQ